MKITILASASQDLVEGYWFYEKQSEGIGAYFLDTLFSDIDSLAIYAGIHEIHFGKYYRLLSKRFPFAVYYRIEEQTACIYAVLDSRKSPTWVRKRLK
ncbi:Plasmid stabilization system [hydrothermal vent metagenome]|uniref:Plasmid stabilization system n=1 Tax=hydrothermal vent metagenome TaxID=652676 RepID=A0A3B1BQT1_9ZZZZ